MHSRRAYFYRGPRWLQATKRKQQRGARIYIGAKPGLLLIGGSLLAGLFVVGGWRALFGAGNNAEVHEGTWEAYTAMLEGQARRRAQEGKGGKVRERFSFLDILKHTAAEERSKQEVRGTRSQRKQVSAGQKKPLHQGKKSSKENQRELRLNAEKNASGALASVMDRISPGHLDQKSATSVEEGKVPGTTEKPQQRSFLLYSNSIPKSGSSLLFQYQQFYLHSKYVPNAQDKIKDFLGQEGRGGVGHFVYGIDKNLTQELVKITQKQGPGLVKTHVGGLEFSENLKFLIKAGTVKMSLIHRDPRDVLLSAKNHAIRAKKTRDAPFQEFLSLNTSIQTLRFYCKRSLELIRSKLVCSIRYVDLLRNPVSTLASNFECLGFRPDIRVLERAVATEERERKAGKGLNNFNTGKLLRFREEMPAEILDLVNQKTGECISALGYDRDQ